MSDSRKSFDEWMAIPVAEGADPANWIGSYAEAVAWETWQARDAEIATLQRELAAAKAENKHLHESLDVAAACATDKNRQLSALQLWQESVLAVDIGRELCRYGNQGPHCPCVMSHDDEFGLWVLHEEHKHRVQHLAAKLAEAQSAFRTITEMTDLEMRDGDAARKIAADMLADHPVPNHIANAGKMVDAPPQRDKMPGECAPVWPPAPEPKSEEPGFGCTPYQQQFCRPDGPVAVHPDCAAAKLNDAPKEGELSAADEAYLDAMEYGAGYMRVDSDGTQTRLHPGTVMVDVRPGQSAEKLPGEQS